MLFLFKPVMSFLSNVFRTCLSTSRNYWEIMEKTLRRSSATLGCLRKVRGSAKMRVPLSRRRRNLRTVPIPTSTWQARRNLVHRRRVRERSANDQKHHRKSQAQSLGKKNRPKQHHPNRTLRSRLPWPPTHQQPAEMKEPHELKKPQEPSRPPYRRKHHLPSPNHPVEPHHEYVGVSEQSTRS